MDPESRTVAERAAEAHELGRLVRGGPAALEPPRPPVRDHPPGPPARDSDLILGVLDRIAEATERLAVLEQGPVGEGTVARAAIVAAPAAAAVLVSLPAPGQGRYRVRVVVAKDAGAVALDAALRIGALTLSPLPVDVAALAYTFDELHVDGGESIDVVSPNGSAATLVAFAAATRVE